MEGGNGGSKLAAAMAELEDAKATAAAAAAAKQEAALEAVAAARDAEAEALAEIKAAMRHEKFKASLAVAVQETQDGEEEEPEDGDDDDDEDPLPPYLYVKDKASLVQALGGPPRQKVVIIDNLPSMREAVGMLEIVNNAAYNVSFPDINKVQYIANHHDMLDKKVRRVTLASLITMPTSNYYRKMLHEQGQAITLMGRHMGGNFGRRADAVGQWMAALSALDDQPESSPLLRDLRGAVNRLLNYPIALR